MARPHVQFCLPESLHQQVLSFKAEHSLSDTEAMVIMIEAFFAPQSPLYITLMRRWGNLDGHTYVAGVHRDKESAVKQGDIEKTDRGGKYEYQVWQGNNCGGVYVADTCGDQTPHYEALLSKADHIPVPKKKPQWKPLSEHTKARLEVYLAFGGSCTSSDIAWVIGQSTNNVSKRIGELAQEGYLEPTGEYRKSRNSGKMLTLWRLTAKVYEVTK